MQTTCTANHQSFVLRTRTRRLYAGRHRACRLMQLARAVQPVRMQAIRAASYPSHVIRPRPASNTRPGFFFFFFFLGPPPPPGGPGLGYKQNVLQRRPMQHDA
jgi:hypothetical protein